MPVHIRPKSGTRNQKKVSCEPSKRSFLVKSNGVSVALPLRDGNQREPWYDEDELALARETPQKVRARKSTGRDERRHWFVLSAKLIKIPSS